ncbi:MAG: hypothetical protein JW888_17345 [Pirellulales bacterium]|nr:hypothetical protein [Pirellulales bacterium]
MPIEFHCSRCGTLLKVPDDTAGHAAKCPACGAVTTVPGAAEPFDESDQTVDEGDNPFQFAAPVYDDEGRVNPYQAPADYSTSSQSYSSAPPRDRVRLPAIFLIVIGALGALMFAFGAITLIVLVVADQNLAGARLSDMAMPIGYYFFGMLVLQRRIRAICNA